MRLAYAVLMASSLVFHCSAPAAAGQVQGYFTVTGSVRSSCEAHGDTGEAGDTANAGNNGNGYGDGGNNAHDANDNGNSDNGATMPISGDVHLKCRRGSSYSLQLVALVCPTVSDVSANSKLTQCRPLTVGNGGSNVSVASGQGQEGTGYDQLIPFELRVQADRELKDRFMRGGLLDIVVTY